MFRRIPVLSGRYTSPPRWDRSAIRRSQLRRSLASVRATVVMHALSKIAPRNISAGVGNLKVTAYSGLVGENYWVYMDITEGSYGGRYGKDGMDCVDTLYANTRNNPIEDIESHYPLRVTRYEMREDKGGPGKWRGGVGSIR